ncbi:MAG: glycosyltransferase family 2 protein [Alphaproteobacteria bacterium]|nr:glycosyltransferase family 2 protein [Alphaproteobacteria bacterium]MCB9697301.1 glycosyltransferase family 2 protein [Alphaproteobacteria bacterium]
MTEVDGPAPRPRFPGWDGWALILLQAVIAVIALVRHLEGMTTPTALVALVAGLYLLGVFVARRPPRVDVPAPKAVRPLVVVPVRNNAGTIGEVVRGCLAHTADVLVVDDGSTDRSGELAQAEGARVVRHRVNLGKGAALHTALLDAAEHGYSHIVALDADGQHLPSELPAFLAAVAARPSAIVAGCRDGASMPRGARGARANSNFWTWVETGRWVGDTQCGYRAYPVRETLLLGLVPSRYQWEVEVLVRAIWSAVPVVDLPCAVYYPPAGERVSSYRKVVDTARVTWLNVQLVLERIFWPGHWLSPTPRDTWHGEHRGFLGGWRLLFWILKVFGRRAVQLAVLPVVTFYWLFLGGTQRAGLDAYLRRRFPDEGVVGLALHRLRVLVSFAFSLVDRFHLLLHGSEGIDFDRTGVPGLRDHMYGEKSGTGLLVLSGHLGNPDFASSALRETGRGVHLLVHRAPTDPYFRLVQETLGDRAPRFIALDDGEQHASIAVLRALRAGDVVAVKADRVVDDRVAVVDFLGSPMRLPTGPLVLAALSGAPVVLLGCFRTGPSSYRFEAVGPRPYAFTDRASRDADLQRWAQELADVMAAWTERYPHQWYNFFDPWG